MPIITYSVKIIFDSPSDRESILDVLKAQQMAYNECSKDFFGLKKENKRLKGLHDSFYARFRKKHPKIPSQIVIRAEQEVLSSYRSICSNGHEIDEPAVKRNLSMQLDKRIYSFKRDPKTRALRFSLTTLKGRVKCGIETYDKINELLDKWQFCDPLIYIRDGQLFMSLAFRLEDRAPSNETVLGVDLGIRVFAATSDGKLYVDKGFNKEKRKLRFLKRQLQAAKANGSKSAAKHLKKLRRKERRRNHNFAHHLTNRIIEDTPAGYIALEDLKGIKAKKHLGQNKNRISQVSFFAFKTILTYKALLRGKQVITVSPRFTSQIDSRTGEKDGKRLGRRYIGSDGVVLDADINAARNIAARSKRPVSYDAKNAILDGQGIVTSPIVGC